MGFSLRGVARASRSLARRRRNRRLGIAVTTLSAVETKGKVPGLFQLVVLARIYRLPVLKVLAWYGVVSSRSQQATRVY